VGAGFPVRHAERDSPEQVTGAEFPVLARINDGQFVTVGDPVVQGFGIDVFHGVRPPVGTRTVTVEDSGWQPRVVLVAGRSLVREGARGHWSALRGPILRTRQEALPPGPPAKGEALGNLSIGGGPGGQASSSGPGRNPGAPPPSIRHPSHNLVP